jgi:hypothetical protein
MSDRLFTPRFFTMCAYSFTVFISLFQLLPTAPYRILELGGGTLAAGLFLGFLTYSSALSAPVTGAIGDKLGQRRVLLTVSLILAGFSTSYAFIRSIPLLLTVVFLHGLFWSALLSASGAYMTATLPEARRGEGIGYWGLDVGAVGCHRAAAWILGLPARLDDALRRHRHAQSHDGDDCVAAARRSSLPRDDACGRGDARASIHGRVASAGPLGDDGAHYVRVWQLDELLSAVCR